MYIARAPPRIKWLSEKNEKSVHKEIEQSEHISRNVKATITFG